MATQYSCWPVFVFPLNLRPGQIMQRKNIFPTLIIPGPNYMYSTHDLPAYALFVGWCVHGRFPCPTCKGALEFRWLQAGRKFSCFDMHRQFLNPRHKFRKDKKNFIRGRVVKNSAPSALTDPGSVKRSRARSRASRVLQGV